MTKITELEGRKGWLAEEAEIATGPDETQDGAIIAGVPRDLESGERDETKRFIAFESDGEVQTTVVDVDILERVVEGI